MFSSELDLPCFSKALQLCLCVIPKPMLSEFIFPTSHSADSVLMMIGTMRTHTVLELEVPYHFAWPLNSLET